MIQGGKLRAFVDETSALICLLAACAATVGCGGSEPELVRREQQSLTTRIFASDPMVIEETLFDHLPSGLFASAAAGGSHLLITQSQTAQVGGYGPRAFVVRDGSVVNSRGVDLSRTGRSIISGSPRYIAVNAGAHWLYAYESELSVLNIDGSLKVKTALTSRAQSMAWGANRALVMVSTGQGQFFDAQGGPLGDPFDIAPTEATRNGGMAFNGSTFLVEYSTLEGVYAVAVTPDGVVGSPVKLADGYAQAFSEYGLGHSVLSDGRTFLVVYYSLADRGVRYRTASVDSSLAVTLGPEHPASGFALGNTKSVFLGDRYILTDDYNRTILHINPDGTLRQSPSTWSPWTSSLDVHISAAPDGTSAIVVDFSGRASRITSELALVGSRLQVGLGPQYQGDVATAFDGSDFWVTWVDRGRSSARQAKVGIDGAVLAPGATQTRSSTGASRPDPLISNGSSVLRVIPANLSAVLTKADGSTVTVDLSALAGTLGYPGLATNGEDYLVVDSVGSSGRAVLVSPEGVVTRTLVFNGGGSWPSATFDGEKYLVGFGSYSGAPPPNPGGQGVLTVTPLSTDLVPGTPKVITSFPNASAARHTLVWNGTQALSVWLVHSETEGGMATYEVRCSRVSRDLELLDDPPVVLGYSASSNQPAVTWDGAFYWVAWADSDASLPWPESDTYLPAIRVVSPEPVNGSILLETDPLTLPGDPIGRVELAARPGGPVLLASTPYAAGSVTTRLLRARALKDGAMVVDEQARQAALQDVSTTSTFLGNE